MPGTWPMSGPGMHDSLPAPGDAAVTKVPPVAKSQPSVDAHPPDKQVLKAGTNVFE